jgi:galactosylceramidase
MADHCLLPRCGCAGGDAQSTEGTEPSHMHSADDENYQRGYEWWLMREAKRRNPEILLYALSWGFPQWVSEGTKVPFTNSTVRYIVNWLTAAKAVHNLTIDYVGIWNERGYTAQYIISLHAAISKAGLSTRIVGHDSNWDICQPILNSSALAAAVDIIGAHYPGTHTDPACQTTGKQLWASEEYSKDWNTGGQCWARVLNQNYVRANITGQRHTTTCHTHMELHTRAHLHSRTLTFSSPLSLLPGTIAWNLIATYYQDLPFPGDGLLQGDSPWSGHYDVGHSLHATSHTTHFTRPGWHFLAHGSGVGLLEGGGSYVSYTNSTELSLVIETMPFNTSQCSWSTSPEYTIAPVQTATFQLDLTSFPSVQSLYLFTSNLTVGADPSMDFTAHGLMPLVNGSITLEVHSAMIYTLSTINTRRGSYATPPAATVFPVPYADDFDSHAIDSEAPFFIDQAGSWQIFQGDSSHDRVMRQWLLEPPVAWCGENPVPFSVIGNHAWIDVNVTVEVMVEQAGGMAFVGARVAGGGCMEPRGTDAVAFGVSTEGWWALCNATAVSQQCQVVGKMTVQPGTWYTLGLVVSGTSVKAYVDGTVTGSMESNRRGTGWAAIGSSFHFVQFDRFSVVAAGSGEEEQASEKLPAVADN